MLMEKKEHNHEHNHEHRHGHGVDHIHSHRNLIGFDEHGIPTITLKSDHEEDTVRFRNGRNLL